MVNIKYIVNKLGNFVKISGVDFYYNINRNFDEKVRIDFCY